jgi:hypothetical protein
MREIGRPDNLGGLLMREPRWERRKAGASRVARKPQAAGAGDVPEEILAFFGARPSDEEVMIQLVLAR